MKSMPICSSCQIDGSEVSSAAVWTHQQDDPFPGGHHFRIIVPTGHPLQPPSALPIHTRIDRQQGGAWFFLLSAVLKRDSGTPFDYVLNTIDSVEQTESGIVIGGIASPFVRDFSRTAARHEHHDQRTTKGEQSAEEMKPATILRLAVIAEIALIPLGIAVSFWADSFLPKDVIALEENQTSAFTDIQSMGPGMIALMVGGFVLLGAWIASIVGLLKLKRWGAWLYLFSTFLTLPVYFMTGFEVRHSIDQIFDDIFRFIPGFIIGLAFFSNAIPKKSSETLHPTAGNDPV